MRTFPAALKRRSLILITGLFIVPWALFAQPTTLESRAGQYDNGKMWTFEYPPVNYLAETYNFRPDAAWFERARLSVLRIPGCSASFISSHGLVVTNHHCVRARVSQVSREDEHLLDTGFYAPTLAEERRIPGYYADQLVAIEDITNEIDEAVSVGMEEALREDGTVERVNTDSVRMVARSIAKSRIELAYKDVPGLNVQIIPLYNGGRYSAYIFRRYSDVRLVMAVELQAGFFGGDGDNFTYPRYALDYAFLRVYGDDGEPISSPDYFGWSARGVDEGDLVFVIGNPGSTSRQATVSQLVFFRDVLVNHTLRTLTDRLGVYHEFYAADPERGEAMDLRNTMFSISNSRKAYSGRADALNDPVLIARRADAEKQFRDALADDPDLADSFGDVFQQIDTVENKKLDVGDEYGAFRLIESARYESALMRRAILVRRYLNVIASDTARVSELRERILSIKDRPKDLEESLLRARMNDFALYFQSDAMLQSSMFGAAGPEGKAEELMRTSALADEDATAMLLEHPEALATDVGVQFAGLFHDRYERFSSQYGDLLKTERELQGKVGRARFAVYGVSVPPDATFSPRFTDGIVKGYRYNGTLAPPYTTLFGMLDHYYSYGGNPDWILPDRLATPPPDLDLSTPLNFVSTSDTIGGNSGSPAVTRDLEIVGLNFDRNIEGLSRDYIYLPERGRNVMVDMRAVKETLDKVYDADRIVLEITTGELFETEAEADALSEN